MDEEKKEVLTRNRFVTWDELCSEDVERDQAETFLARYGRYIKHRTRVPLDMLLLAQRRYMSGKKKDIQGYFVHLLRYLLLEPHVENEKQAQALLKADGKVMLDIIGAAVGDVSDLADEEEEAGES